MRRNQTAMPEPAERFQRAMQTRKTQTGLSYRAIADRLAELTDDTPSASTVHRWTAGNEFSVYDPGHVRALSAWLTGHHTYREWTPQYLLTLRDEIRDALMMTRVPRGEIKARLRLLETAEQEREDEMEIIREEQQRMLTELETLRAHQLAGFATRPG